jgi:TRAP-type C4-dicarboxylate transport system permease small subunit
MAELTSTQARPTDPVGRVLYKITRIFALWGGLVLCSMALMTTVSVIGRYFFNAPILGDFELIAIGTGVGVFLFMPYCHLMRENVIVDFFMSATPFRTQAFFDIVGNLVYALIMTLMTWRMYYGGFDLYEADEMTLILEIPRWWTFPAALVCLALLVTVCFYTVVRSINEMRLGRTL